MKDRNFPNGREATPIPTPLNPPSKAVLLTGITERIVDAFGGEDEEARDKVIAYLTVECQPPWQEDFRKLIDQWYENYPEINILDILDETIKNWRDQGRLVQSVNQNQGFYSDISKLIWEFRLALGTKYNSIPPETWMIRAALNALGTYSDYPFDEKLDADLIVRAIRRFPEIDLVEQIDRKVIWWQEHPNAVKAENKSARVQLWQWFEYEEKYQQKNADRNE